MGDGWRSAAVHGAVSVVPNSDGTASAANQVGCAAPIDVGRGDPTLRIREPLGSGGRVGGKHLSPGFIGQAVIHRMLELVI